MRLLKKFLNYFFNINFKYSVNFGLFPSNFYKKINNLKCEVINLHWIGNEMISVNQISKIKKYLIWTLHDMWPYTSVENYMEENEFIDLYVKKTKKNNFFCNYIFNKKIQHFKNIKLIICTSSWQKKLCEKSEIFKDIPKKIIPLPLDFNLWIPKNKKDLRKEYNIPENFKVVLFVLSHKYASKRKGIDFTIKYLENSRLNELCLLTTNCNNLKINNPNLMHINFNNINTIAKMIDLYSNSDLLLMPSRLESFGQTILEAQACNCPAVTFKNTGCEDIIDHLKTGYLSEYLNFSDFSKGVELMLKKDFKDNSIRKIAENKFSEKIVATKYQELFENLF